MVFDYSNIIDNRTVDPKVFFTIQKYYMYIVFLPKKITQAAKVDKLETQIKQKHKRVYGPVVIGD